MTRGAVWLIVLAACHGSDARDPSRVLEERATAPRGDALFTDGTGDMGPMIDAGVPDAGTIAPFAAEPACVPVDVEGNAGGPAAREPLTISRTKFADLPAWKDDAVSEAVPSLLRSCDQLATLADNAPIGVDGHGGRASQWRHACAAAAKVAAGDNDAARTFFETEFVPWVAAGKAGPNGKMTGYYVQELHGSRTKHDKFKYPVFGRPSELVMVDLGKFIGDSHGKRVWGRVDAKGELVPMFTRAEIRKGALDNRKLELMYVDDPTDLLFAHIEGSAKAKLDDGTLVWLEFAGKNGRAYKGVGGVLKEIGAFTHPGQGTMQGIHKWFDDNPKRFDEVVDQSSAFVFFGESKQPGAVGSQGVILTAQRSMAVDRSLIAHSTPIWVETNAPRPGMPGAEPWHHLLIAQDTGGGINGAVRGDIYWGDDAVASDLGGRMGGAGRYWLLLPKGVEK
jgi:membrane-bound lytic murein transglycosylase A